jgi:hypothetical protein
MLLLTALGFIDVSRIYFLRNYYITYYLLTPVFNDIIYANLL